MTSFEAKRRCRRLVNDSVFADRKLIGHNWRGHYSITSSARASNLSGTSRPSVLAVLRLMTSSNLVGCMTGRSTGLAAAGIEKWIGRKDQRRGLLLNHRPKGGVDCVICAGVKRINLQPEGTRGLS